MPIDAFAGGVNDANSNLETIAPGPPPDLWADLPVTSQGNRPGDDRLRMIYRYFPRHEKGEMICFMVSHIYLSLLL